MLPTIEFKILDERASLPVRAHPTDAGLDLASLNDVNLNLMERSLVKTGLSVRIPTGYVGLLVPRSSLSKKNIMLTNSCGIIDADYRGELLISLMYVNKDDTTDFDKSINYVPHQHISAGERIAQLLIVPIALPEPLVYTGSYEDWNNTQRGAGGFGSTGR